MTFNADGSWTYLYGGGRWVQVEGMYFFNFSNAAGLVYTANITKDALVGIMGYAVSGPSPGSGCWWGTRPGAPHALLATTLAPGETKEAQKEAQKEAHDILLGPAHKRG